MLIDNLFTLHRLSCIRMAAELGAAKVACGQVADVKYFHLVRTHVKILSNDH